VGRETCINFNQKLLDIGLKTLNQAIVDSLLVNKKNLHFNGP